MALTRAATGLTVEQWNDEFFVEYVQDSVFYPYMGKDEQSVVQINEALTRKKGDRFTFALVNRMTQAAVTGNNTLEGNEEDVASRSYELAVDLRRFAARIPKMEEQRSAIDLREAARAVLKMRGMEDLRDRIIAAMYSIDGVEFGSTTAAQRNTWVTNNADRVLFGRLVSNYSSTFATAMATLDNTDDKLTADTLSLAKRRAMLASPKITPIEVKDGKRVLVAFAHTLAFRDLAKNLQTVNREAWVRGLSNPIFTGADLFYEGIVIKEVDDMPLLPANATINGVAVGNTVQASPVFLCGAQAVAVAYAQRSRSIEKRFDYDKDIGIAIEEISGVGKMRFGTGSDDTTTPKDRGVFTLWVATPAEA